MNKNSCDVGIAITTYLRKDMVCKLVDRIRELTRSDYKIVVCDDGSLDGTKEELQKKRYYRLRRKEQRNSLE
ncbi:glycosyltransferase family 2 protein [Gluconobacter albidus]|uniref:Glycosyltransferase 2-like domain-containing protein n=1 Tax=Gluconobacter albidus TaxID=318683 RepID=A0ABQ5X350_9PROT|nr:glycosyltransferase [Gluconobacter albidus]GBQ89722.1 hypothetical protein AA3250_1877 [Gluconobacter albidus NBRC 3250]GLQ69654.1 hypothetical protein GCM10007866_21070 [Gluconobacter albidus]